MFEMCEREVVIPTKIRIRNSAFRGRGIKAISLSIGKGDGSWHKLVDDVTDIHNENNEEQEFLFGQLLRTPQWISEYDAKYIWMQVRENHGSEYFNACYGFRLFAALIV